MCLVLFIWSVYLFCTVCCGKEKANKDENSNAAEESDQMKSKNKKNLK